MTVNLWAAIFDFSHWFLTLLVITIMDSWRLNGSFFCFCFFKGLLSSCTGLSVYFFLSLLSLVFLSVCLSLSVRRREKAERSLSCSLKSNRRDTAESCLSSPVLVCSHFISPYLLSGESTDQRRWSKKTTTCTALTHLHVLCTFMFPAPSGAHRGTLLCICILPHPYPWFLFLNWVEERPCVCLSVDQIKSFQWSPPGSWLCVRSVDSGRARQTSGDAPVTPRSLLWWVTSKDVHI